MRRALLLFFLSGCADPSSTPGLEAWLRVSGAQYVAGAPAVGAAGPAVLAFDTSRDAVEPGDSSLHLGGALAPGANAVVLWLEGDRGSWLLPAGLPDVTLPEAPTFSVTAAVAREAPPGQHVLHAMARSAEGVAGPAASAALGVLAPATPQAELIISLSWDTHADLDLHVVDATGVEIWARNPNSWQAVPGAPPAPDAWRGGGLLDLDSNGQCVIDGRNRENVAWQQPPPAGHYLVRVDAFSLCDQAAASWTVGVVYRGERLGAAQGVATFSSSRPPHELGSGVLAVEFDVP